MAGYLNTPANSPGLFSALEPDNQLKYQQLGAARAFQNGIPTDANGQPDFGAMAARMYTKGDFADGNSMMQTGLAQQQLRAAQAPSAVLGGGQPAVTPGTPTPKSSYTVPSPGFDSAVDRTLGFEGGWNKGDTNGTPTNYGINQAAHPDIDVSKLTPDQAKAIYKSDYWDSIDGDNLSPGMSRAAFDTAVIAGPAKAKELMAQSGGDPMKLMTLREQFQQGLIQSDPQKYAQYATAWNRRNNGLRYDIMAFGSLARQQGAGGAPGQVAQNGASGADPDPESVAPSNQHPFAPSKPAFQKPTEDPSPQMPGAPPQMAGGQPQMPTMGGQQQPMLTPVGLNGPTQGGAPAAPPPPPPPSPSPLPITANPPTRWASNGSNFVDPTLGGLVSPEQLQRYGSYGGVAKAAAAEAATLGGNPYGKERAAVLLDYSKQIMGMVAKAQELTTEQKNARDATVLGYESQRDANKAQARVDAQNSAVAVQGAGARAEASEEGKTLGQVPAQLATAADNAKLQSNLVAEMLDAGNQFRMGPGASTQQNFNAKLSALGDAMGVDTSSIKGQVAGYTDFNKLAGQLTRQSIKETGSSRAGIQEMQMVSGSLPSPDMSRDGFKSVAGQIQGLNDYALAKQQVGQTWLDQRHSMAGFETSWNKNVSPAAFVLHRLQQDQPDLFASTVQRMAQTPQGRGVLSNVKSGLAWGSQNGLF